MNEIVFRVDANAGIGMGHLYRCLSLAAMLDGYNLTFCMQRGDPSVKSVVEQAGYNFAELNAESFADFALKRFPVGQTLVVFDGYDFDRTYQSIIKAAGFRTVFIDDFAAFPMVADIVINTADISPDKYTFSGDTKLLLGHEFTLLRPEFLKRATQSASAARKQGKIMISLGATDPQNYTRQVLSILMGQRDVTEVVILASELNPHLDTLREMANTAPFDVVFTSNASAAVIISLFEKSEVAILSSSNIANEAICTGVPVICIQTATNQEELFNTLTTNGLCAGIADPGELIARLPALLKHLDYPAVTEKMIARQKSWFDGRSPERIRAHFNELLGS